MLVALATPGAINLYSFFPSSDPPLVLTASSPAPLADSLVWHNDGSKFLSISKQDGVECWSKDGNQMYGLERTDDDADLPVSSAHFIDRQAVLLTSGSMAYLYSSPAATSGHPPASYGGHPRDSDLSSLAVNVDESFFATCTTGGSLIVYNRTTGTQSTLHTKAKAAFSLLKFHPTRRTFLAAATLTGHLHIFDTTRPSAPLRTFALSPSPLPSPLTALAFSPLGAPLLLACTLSGALSLVDIGTMKVVGNMEVGAEVQKGGMALGSDGRSALFAGAGGRGAMRWLDLKDVKGRKPVRELKVEEGRARLGAVAFQPVPARQKATPAAPASPTKGSVILSESINRMRASLAHRTASPTKEQTAPRALDDIAEMFSPVQFGGSKVVQREMGREDLPQKVPFAESLGATRINTSRLASATSLTPSLLYTSQRTTSASSYRTADKEQRPLSSASATSSTRTSGTTSSTAISTSTSTSSSRPHARTRLSPPLEESRSSSSMSTNLELPSMSLISPGLGRSLPLGASTSSHSVVSHASSEGERPTDGDGTFRVKDRKATLDKMGDGDGYREGNGRHAGDDGAEAEGRREKEKDARRVGFLSPEEQRTSRKDGGKLIATPRRAPVDLEGSVEDEGEEEDGRGATSGHAGGSELLKAAVRDAMEEYHIKSSQDIRNLHLEMLKQAFTQKTEMKTLLVQYLGGELTQLRADNTRLKMENERLRRGY